MNLLRTKPRELAAPTGMLSRMRDELDRVFDRFVREPFDLAWPGNGSNWMPALDLVDGETEVTIKAEVPGMSAKDVDVSVSGNMLTLSGRKEESKEDRGENYFISERRFGAFQRTIELPEGVDAEKIVAEQENGVLTVKIPKLKTAKPKHIAIKSPTKA